MSSPMEEGSSSSEVEQELEDSVWNSAESAKQIRRLGEVEQVCTQAFVRFARICQTKGE